VEMSASRLCLIFLGVGSVHFFVCRPASVRSAGQSPRECDPPLRVGVIARVTDTVDWTEDRSSCPRWLGIHLARPRARFNCMQVKCASLGESLGYSTQPSLGCWRNGFIRPFLPGRYASNDRPRAQHHNQSQRDTVREVNPL
jgi:hypothetical protein